MTDRLDGLCEFARAFASERGSVRISGTICEVGTNQVRVEGISRLAHVGDLIEVSGHAGTELAEIIHLDPVLATAVPYDRQSSIGLGARAALSGPPAIRPHTSWLGRVIDPLGNALDDGEPLTLGPEGMLLDREPPRALSRNRVHQKLKTGIKAIDCFTPICSGQRMGIFAGSGVGKSTLLAMLSAVPDVPVVVLALVGERGREVREFLEDVLGSRRQRVVTVVATGDASPAVRRLAPKAAVTVAEYFRAKGNNVLLMIDSITRFAHAQREYALAGKEPPVARGYPPSVFAEIARLLERCGPGPNGEGDITALVTVLVDGDDHNDPVSDSARGILDGHIVLSRKIAALGRWPAIDLLSSLSRLADKAWTAQEANIVQSARAMIARYEDTRDLRLIGGYQHGTDPDLDKSVACAPRLYEFLNQRPDDRVVEHPIAVLGTLIQSPSKI
ncbi:MAG: flagellar protein export ATPase FliI [Hyphomicrobium sp.]|nr:flagellar protein export ATPase FliI [Hyphomicrobium sp.]